jgi:hypothetical protein
MLITRYKASYESEIASLKTSLSTAKASLQEVTLKVQGGEAEVKAHLTDVAKGKEALTQCNDKVTQIQSVVVIIAYNILPLQAPPFPNSTIMK